MNAAPEQKEGNERRHIPEEILEIILLKLPVESIIRFARVSKAWRSMIFDLGFKKGHRRHAAVERIMMCLSPHYIRDTFSCSTSSVSPFEDLAKIIRPIQRKQTFVVASCDELLCVQDDDKSLYLWNPSMRMCLKVPDPESVLPPEYKIGKEFQFSFGLGYDPVGDDYKLLIIYEIKPYDAYDPYDREIIMGLYSVRSNSWRKIAVPGSPIGLGAQNGAFHWINDRGSRIISLNLSSEEFAEEVAHPLRGWVIIKPELGVLKGKLCVLVVLYNIEHQFTRLVLWSKETDSWRIILDFDFNNPDFTFSITTMEVRPFYSYDNGDILLKLNKRAEPCAVLMYKREENTLKNILRHGQKIRNAHLYLQTPLG